MKLLLQQPLYICLTRFREQRFRLVNLGSALADGRSSEGLMDYTLLSPKTWVHDVDNVHVS